MDIIEIMESRLRSGNSVPVERAHITRKEWDAVTERIAELEEQIKAAQEQEPTVWSSKSWIQEAKRGNPGYIVGEERAGFTHPLYAAPIPAPVSVPEWQPIETAPKDEMILLAGVMDHASDWRIKVGYCDSLGEWKIFGASWEPTHWMPIPAAPTKEKE